jgi:pimeloyl-ACP methyl ester carboxylesterase
VFIRDNPEKVSAMILCGTGGQFPPNLPKFETTSEKAGEKMSEADRFFVTYCGSQFRIQHPERAQRLFEELRAQQTIPGAAKRRAQAIQSTPSDTYWGKIPASIPVLLLYGTEDRFGTPENAGDLNRRLEGSRLVFFDGAGHFVIREEPDRMFEEIQKFIKEKEL